MVAFVKAGTGHALPGAGHLSAAWLSPWTGSFRGLANSFLLAVFVYWGWDCAVSVNEETKDRARTPGRAAVTSTVLLVAVFAVVSVAALVFAGPAFMAQHSDNVLGAMSTLVLGSTAGKLLILCVLTSATASTQTTIMPTARAALAMAAHRALPRAFARMHPRFLTPTVATVVMGAASAVFFVVLTLASQNVLADSAASVGLLIAFYYGLTGFACVWFFRRDLLGSVRALVFKGILPGFGGLALLAAFVLSIVSYWPAASSYSSFDGIGGVFLIGAGSLLVGVALMLAARRWLPAFFTTGTLPPLAAAEDDAAPAGDRTAVAPDRRRGGVPEPAPSRPLRSRPGTGPGVTAADQAGGRPAGSGARPGRPRPAAGRKAQGGGARSGGPGDRRAGRRRHQVRRRGRRERRAGQHAAVLLRFPRGPAGRRVPARVGHRDRGAGGRPRRA